MDGFLAICLTVIFAAWVWTLKHQLADATDRLTGAHHGSLRHRHRPPAPPNAERPETEADESAATEMDHMRKRGIKTWVIA